MLLIIGSTVAVIILGLISLKEIFFISHQLNSMKRSIDDASRRRDLTLRLDDSRQDEIGKLALSFNEYADCVLVSLSKMHASAYAINLASAKINRGNEALFSQTEHQAASLEETTVNITELVEIARKTEKNTLHASNLLRKACIIVNENSRFVTTLFETMNKVKGSAVKISDIIVIIDDVALQTNILALNAAVEALCAGEHGYGFAEVANELRNLAQRTTSSAREIKMLIESSNFHVEINYEQVEAVAKNIEKMDSDFIDVNNLVNDMAEVAAEQSQRINQIYMAINQIDAVTQHNADLIMQASAVSHTLLGEAGLLFDTISTFKFSSSSQGSDYKMTEKYFLKLSEKTMKGVRSTIATGNWHKF